MVRPYSATDLPVIEAIHRVGGLDYRLPDLNSPLIVAHQVYEGPDGVQGSVFLRLTAETFLLLDPTLHPQHKFSAIQQLNDAIVLEAWRLGLDDLNARIPPEINQRFAKRLTQLGWERGRSSWVAWSKTVGVPSETL